MADGDRDFLGAPEIGDDFTVIVPGEGRLSAGQIVHAVPGGAALAMQMKAAAMQGQNTGTERPFQRGRISGMPFSTQGR